MPSQQPAAKQKTYEVKKTDFKIHSKKLGQGAFAPVYQGTLFGKNERVAVKLLRASTEKEANKAKREIQIVKLITEKKIPYVTEIQAYYIGSENLNYYLMITLAKGTVSARLFDLNFKQQLTISYQISIAVKHLHTNNIIHGDLKTENVLLQGEDDRVLVTDFGNARRIGTDSLDQISGTPTHMAPELLLKKNDHDTRADIYSLGVTFWEIVARKKPYQDFGSLADLTFSLENNYREVIPPEPETTRPLADLIQRCWQTNPDHRPSANTVMLDLEEQISELAVKEQFESTLVKKKP